ncbi:hypothetical protein SAMN05421833_13263 [Microbispora rosea]|uniref:WD40-like Beta Propeller Repeat n=1 Tax=Microbispora rosea TaxID=58117 RepID=A0A1N7GTE9_9ACTN|nr:hypothetical protein [Microbispora rosea]GIH51435.1 hypothetical protein Mro03_66140 [Microbispora rosea subsp. rosea]SIS15863.1 hypothetical protein SAMN05421833_13263 [Microbispora rosea]
MRNPTLPITLPITSGLVGLALSTFTISAASAPAAATAHHSIRYASVDACTAKDGTERPCHTWRVDLLDGRRVALEDAMLWPLNAKGKVDKSTSAPLTVSGDGDSVAYFRKSDHRLVVREFHGGVHGAVHVMPKTPLPRGIGMDSVWLDMSQDGSRLALAYTDDDGVTRGRLFDVARATATGTIPKSGGFSGFSGDGSAVLLQQDAPANTTGLSVHDVTGAELTGAVPPQIVANNGPWALSADDRTVAFVTGSGKKAALRFYDVRTDQTTGSVRFSLPGDTSPDMIDWTGEHEVTVHVTDSEGGRDVVTVLRIDTRTGTTRVRDRYKVRAGIYTYQSCGG